MAKLAIKGHPTRGKEVIQLLEMLGGTNDYFKHDGKIESFYYYIGDFNNHIYQCGLPSEMKCFTLEEFEEKFPYKVGDKVTTIYGKEGIVSKLIWSQRDECVRYELEADLDSLYFANELQPYKEDTVEEEKENFAECIEKTIQECLFGEEGATKEIKIDIPEGYEFFGIDDNNKVVLTKIQPQYPKTYEECCQVLMGKTDFQDFELVLTRYTITRSEENSISLCPPHISLINNFYKLLICRDVYWKIAGEYMGLDKPWEPDWDNLSTNHEFIKINKGCFTYSSRVLVFPTAEMRDAFYDNFKELINECKELL